MAARTQTQGKSKNQLYMIAGLGVVLAVILVIQVPKLLGGGGSEAAPTSTTDSVPTAGTAETTGEANSVPETAVLGGVTFVPGLAPKPGEGQLASFSLFDRHDPFVQLVKESEAGASGSQDGEPTGVKVSGGTSPTGSASGSAGSSGSTSTVPGSSALTSATIWVNGTDEAVDVKKKFPKADPTFVLVSLKSKVAKIAVAGGAFTGGGTITLRMGQTLTLVNTTTGARYTLRLLYTGSEPEKVQQFTQADG
jgi:hypothetical protein